MLGTFQITRLIVGTASGVGTALLVVTIAATTGSVTLTDFARGSVAIGDRALDLVGLFDVARGGVGIGDRARDTVTGSDTPRGSVIITDKT
jgi:hypothetical protein